MPNSSSHYDLAAWRAASSETFGKLEVHAPEASTFWAQLTSTKVGEVSLFDMHTAPHSVKGKTQRLPTPRFASSACNFRAAPPWPKMAEPVSFIPVTWHCMSLNGLMFLNIPSSSTLLSFTFHRAYLASHRRRFSS